MAFRPPSGSSSSSSQESNLFAGLTFPEVPTSLIVIQKNSRKADSGVDVAPQMERVENVSSETEMTEIQVQQQPSAPPVVQAIMQSSSLASLYAPSSTATAAKRYPDLSALRPSTVVAPTTTTTQFSASIASTAETDEHTGLLSSAAQESDTSNSALINELMAENARLTEENARLQRERDNSRLAQAVPTSANGMYNQSTIVGNASMGGTGSMMHAPAQGIRVQGTSPPAQREGIKYVCCGTCRQWLLSPRDAMYVFCPQCRCVNNCGGMPPSSVDATSEVRAARRNDENMFLPKYIMDCFNGVFR